jgi:hypothetical protein
LLLLLLLLLLCRLCWRWWLCQVVHAGQHLRHDASLHLALSSVALGGDRVDLIDEDYGRRSVHRLLCDV